MRPPRHRANQKDITAARLLIQLALWSPTDVWQEALPANPSTTTQETKTLKAKPTGRAEGETAAGHRSLRAPLGSGGRGPTGSSLGSQARSLRAAGLYVHPRILPALCVWLLKQLNHPTWYGFSLSRITYNPLGACSD